jgi:hypothetical protein
MNSDGSQLERITDAPDFDGFPIFSPDGKTLAFSSNRGGKARGETNVFLADWVKCPNQNPPNRSRPITVSQRIRLARRSRQRQGRGVGSAASKTASQEIARWMQSMRPSNPSVSRFLAKPSYFQNGRGGDWRP